MIDGDVVGERNERRMGQELFRNKERKEEKKEDMLESVYMMSRWLNQMESWLERYQFNKNMSSFYWLFDYCKKMLMFSSFAFVTILFLVWSKETTYIKKRK